MMIVRERCGRLLDSALALFVSAWILNGFFGLLNENVYLGQNCFEEYDDFIYNAPTSLALSDLA